MKWNRWASNLQATNDCNEHAITNCWKHFLPSKLFEPKKFKPWFDQFMSNERSRTQEICNCCWTQNRWDFRRLERLLQKLKTQRQTFIKVKRLLFVVARRCFLNDSPLSPFTEFRPEHYKLWESRVVVFKGLARFYCVFNLFFSHCVSDRFNSISNSSS